MAWSPPCACPTQDQGLPQSLMTGCKSSSSFLLEDDKAYKACNVGISGGMLVLLIANSQGVEEYLNHSQTTRLAGGVSHLAKMMPSYQVGGVECCKPHVRDFPVGGHLCTPNCQIHSQTQAASGSPSQNAWHTRPSDGRCTCHNYDIKC